MFKIAIVGNIASGKSTVTDYLMSLGYSVLDTDSVAHELLNLYENDIIKFFNEDDILDSNGRISREKLGRLVFNDDDKKLVLEKFIHPLVKNEIEKFFVLNKNESFVFVAIPLLFEVQMEDLFDKIVFIYCDDEIRLRRLIKRNNYPEEYAKVRMKSQVSQDEKIEKSDFVIYNNSTVEALKKDVLKLLESIDITR